MGCACACVCEREWDRERESKSQFCDFFPPSKSLSLCYTWMNCNFSLWNFEVFFFLYFQNKLYRGKIYNKEATILSVQIHECSFMSLFSWPKLFCHAPSFFFFFFWSFLKNSGVCWPLHSPSSRSSYKQKNDYAIFLFSIVLVGLPD